MSECSHDCSSCGENCAQKGIEKEKQNEKSNIKKIIGVVSGKGGVGKSFVTSILAATAKKEGYNVAILDADKEGFLRNKRSLIQTIGRAARNVSGKVIMYADKQTDSLKGAVDETRRRRKIQEKFNKENGIEPTTIRKKILDITDKIRDNEDVSDSDFSSEFKNLSTSDAKRIIDSLEEQMYEASIAFDFEEAAKLRDELVKVKSNLTGDATEDILSDLKKTARKARKRHAR